MKTRLLSLLLVSSLVAPALVMAQTEWGYQAFWPQTLANAGVGSGHGIAVDPDGKIWFQAFSATDSVQVAELNNEYVPVRVIYVFNPDGSDAAISPIKFLDFGGGDIDTLGGFLGRDANGELAWEGKSGRGLRADADGNILASQFNFLYRIDYQTGAGLDKARFTDYCSLSAPAAATNGNTFVGPVCPGVGVPIRVLDADFNFVENVTADSYGFSRSFEASPDGNSVIWFGYTLHNAVVYSRPDEFSAFDSSGVALEGMDSESLAINSATGNIWVSAGSPNDPPNNHPTVVSNWLSQTWYEFALDDVLDLDGFYTPLSFFTWNTAENGWTDGRPRGVAFSPDGMTAYATQFNQTAPSVQSFAPGAVGIDRVDDTVPDGFTLKQNYPNPFNPTTTIEFELAAQSHAALRIFDLLGRQVAELVNEPLAAGTYTFLFDASDLSSGTYVYTLETETFRKSANMTILK